MRVLTTVSIVVVMGAALASAQTASPNPAKSGRSHHKPKAVKEMPPPQPVAIPQMSPEQLPAQAPRVTYQNGQLTVDSQNSTMSDVLNAIRRQTGAQLEIPPGAGNDRVAAHLAGPPREVVASLLDGSNLGYIILGSPENPNGLQKVILTVLPKNAGTATTATASNRPPEPAQTFQAAPPDYSPDEDQPEVMTDRNPVPPEQNASPQPGVPSGMQPGMPPGVQPGMPGQPAQIVPGQPNPAGDASQNPFGAGGQPVQMAPNPNQPQNPDQPQVKTPDQLLQELQRMRNRQQNPEQQAQPQ